MTIKFESEIKYFPLLIPLWGGGQEDTRIHTNYEEKKKKKKWTQHRSRQFTKYNLAVKKNIWEKCSNLLIF